MDTKDRRLQRIFILIPGMLIFYYYVFKSKLYLVYVLASIQFTTHLYLMYTGKTCTPKINNLCNRFALIIGVIFLCVVVNYKLGIIPLLISVYMVVSHIITIYPLRFTFEYKDIELPILKLSSYSHIYYDWFS